MSECIEWSGALYVNGYPEAQINGVKVRVHRYVWEWINGRKLKPWPEEVILHTCDNRKCVNPDHLIAGTQADNLADMRSKGRGWFPPRKSHCKRGHELTDSNMYVYKGERQGCKQCKVERLREWRASR
jgi:hypothetical protein